MSSTSSQSNSSEQEMRIAFVDSEDDEDLDIMPQPVPMLYDDEEEEGPRCRVVGPRRGDESLQELVDSLPKAHRLKTLHIAKMKNAQARMERRDIPVAFVHNTIVPPGYEPLKRRAITFDHYLASRENRYVMAKKLEMYKQQGELARLQHLTLNAAGKTIGQ